MFFVNEGKKKQFLALLCPKMCSKINYGPHYKYTLKSQNIDALV